MVIYKRSMNTTAWQKQFSTDLLSADSLSLSSEYTITSEITVWLTYVPSLDTTDVLFFKCFCQTYEQLLE